MFQIYSGLCLEMLSNRKLKISVKETHYYALYNNHLNHNRQRDLTALHSLNVNFFEKERSHNNITLPSLSQ